MAGKSVEDVLAQLERVFSGEIEHDEALMELGLHTAQVRKTYPNLFNALRKDHAVKANVIDQANIERIAHELLSKISNTQQTVLPIANTQPTTPTETEPILYSHWAKNEAHLSTPGDEWLVDWDVPQAPVPAIGQSLTLRGMSHKVRFTVKDLRSETVMLLEAIAILPLN